MVQGMIRVWLWCMALWMVGVSATEQPIRAWNLLLDHPNPAVVQLLRLSLDLTVPEYGPYQLVSSPQMEQGRAVKELRSGELDVGLMRYPVVGQDINVVELFHEPLVVVLPADQ